MEQGENSGNALLSNPEWNRWSVEIVVKLKSLYDSVENLSKQVDFRKDEHDECQTTVMESMQRITSALDEACEKMTDRFDKLSQQCEKDRNTATAQRQKIQQLEKELTETKKALKERERDISKLQIKVHGTWAGLVPVLAGLVYFIWDKFK